MAARKSPANAAKPDPKHVEAVAQVISPQLQSLQSQVKYPDGQGQPGQATPAGAAESFNPMALMTEGPKIADFVMREVAVFKANGLLGSLDEIPKIVAQAIASARSLGLLDG